jgi:hypothetical protein
VGWRDLLRTEEPVTAPWTGGRTLHSGARTFTLEGPLPDEHGLHLFLQAGGRRVTWQGPAPVTPELWFGEGTATVTGYLVGDRLVADGAAVPVDVKDLMARTETVHLVEPGLDRFARVTAARHTDGRLYYLRQEFPLGPVEDVRTAYVDRAASVAHVSHVTPALDLAFRVTSWQRDEVERRRAELERKAQLERERAEAEAARHKLMSTLGDGASRRVVAARDFETAARAALRASGADLLDHRKGYNKGEQVVQFRFKKRRFECVCEETTLRIVDAGICLIDHDTGERGDNRFTLESLPGVIQEAMDGGKLVVFRHV